VAERLTTALKPFRTVVVTVEEFDPPCTALTAVGITEIVKSGVAVTVRFTVALCTVPPEVPVMVMG
jgi:hypothetical protein